jgi:oligopeptide transport system permease protein
MVSFFNNIANLLGGAEMIKYVFRRLLVSIPVMLLIIFGAFMLMRVIPGGPFATLGGRSRDAVSLAALNARYGLDKPLLINLPNDGISPDTGMQTKTQYSVLPPCDLIRQGVSPADARSQAGNGVEIEEGWALLRWTKEHHSVVITAPTGEKVPCDEVRTVLYSDLARSQFLQYLFNVMRLNFGPSLGQTTRGQDVSDIISARLPVSMLMGVLAAFFGFLVGIPIGVLAAVYRNTAIDYGASFLSTVASSVPSFVLGPFLIIVFIVWLRWLPGPTPEVWLKPNLLDWNFVSRLILPLATLIFGVAAGIARLTRASLLQVLGDDYIRTARSKGLRERSVIYIHALKNSLIPVVTILGPFLAGILTGTFFVERIFNIPGLGDTFLSSIGERDYTLLTGVTILYASFLVVGNILVDVMYTWLDPRIRFD